MRSIIKDKNVYLNGERVIQNLNDSHLVQENLPNIKKQNTEYNIDSEKTRASKTFHISYC